MTGRIGRLTSRAVALGVLALALAVGGATAGIEAAADLQQVTLDLQRGPRGFIITGDPRFLEPFTSAVAEYPEAIDRLVASANTAAASARARAIGAEIASLDREFSTPLVATARRSLRAARAVVARGEGRRWVDSIVRSLDRLKADEARVVQASRDDAEASADRAIALAIGGLGLSALLMAAFVAFLHSSVVRPAQELAATAGRLAAGDLSARSSDAGAEHELGQMSRAFNAMAESLEAAFTAARKAEAARDEFFALVSHELRTPLTSIVGHMELLVDDINGIAELTLDERARFLEVINHNSRRLLRLVGDLLFVARLEAGRLDLERTRVDLARPVRDSVEAAEPRAARARHSLISDIEEGVVVNGDEGRIGQALDNLISNAVKFTPDGGQVTVRLSSDANHGIIAVSDTGIGVPEAEHQQLFERFFRASTGARAEGVGLGLAITLAIVRGHEGRLEVESEAGRGSTFRIRLPLDTIRRRTATTGEPVSPGS